MARHDSADDYGRARDVGLIASDHLHRALLRNDLVLEREVLALGAGEKPVARTRTDARGYFKLVIGADAGATSARGGRLPVVEASGTPAGAATTTTTVRLVVRRGDHEVFRDAQGIDVRPGRVRYRELGLEEH